MKRWAVTFFWSNGDFKSEMVDTYDEVKLKIVEVAVVPTAMGGRTLTNIVIHENRK